MALVLADRVLETTTTTGSGTITLAGAEPGYQSFSAVGDGNQTYYTITGDTEWEVGIGTYTASGTTFSRDTVLSSSNSGAKVTFSAGVKKVFVTYPAGKAVYENASDVVVVSDLQVTSATIATLSGTTATYTNLTVSNTANASISGNAGTATKLATARTINGVSFDGSANITITANTPNAATFNNAGTGDASGTTFDGSAARTISYNTIGAPSTTGTNASGTWGISISGNAATATTASNVNNGTLTMNVSGTGLSGSQTFTANQSGNATFTVTSNATSANTANTIVARDGSGNFSAGTITATLNGNASTATTASNVNNGTLTMNVSGTGLSGSQTFTANQSGNATFTVTSNATSANTANTIVARDGSGNFTAGTVTLTGLTVSNTIAGSINGTANYANNLTQGFNSNWNTDFAAAPAGSTILRGDTSTGSSTGGPGGTWWFQQNMRHTNGSNVWGVQVAWGWEDNANILRTRNVTGGSYGSWVTYLNSSNYNSYAPTLTGGGASGNWNISAANIYTTQPTIGYAASGQSIAYTSQLGPQILGQGGSASAITFHRPGAYAINLGLDTDNVVKIGGWSAGAVAYPIITSNNIASYIPATSPIASIQRGTGSTPFPYATANITISAVNTAKASVRYLGTAPNGTSSPYWSSQGYFALTSSTNLQFVPRPSAGPGQVYSWEVVEYV